MARVVVATAGSWGDLFPVLGLSKALADDGHDVVVAASPAHRSIVEGERVQFLPVGPSMAAEALAAEPKIFDGGLGGFTGFAHLFRNLIFPTLGETVDQLIDALTGADLLLAHPALVAAPIAAEVVGIRWASVSVFPGLLPTAHAPATPMRMPPLPGPLRRGVNRFSWAAGKANMRRLFDGPVNAARKRVGLASKRDTFFIPVASGNPYLVLASPTVARRQPDWGSNIELMGFVTWDQPGGWGVPEKVEDFLGAGPAPVLITLGATSSIDHQGFYERAVAAVNDLGHRALVLTGQTPEPPTIPTTADAIAVPFAPLTDVAARCTAAVHHAGAGASTTLLTLGIPQLAVPRCHDQPQTAARLRDLGVAEVLPWKRASQARIATALSRVLADDTRRERAANIATALQSEDGVAATVARVRQFMDRR